ncbi:ubiquinone/menaquinone biosynthesis methyltransferase [Sulfobacillus thermosulfidooxidans]|uniref:ubiquinone/menaquinone biosynthesis methyltransferase n=1 Tax=Sulfobacillus thermosulfidooxidans TaxID=28034 RepID=UPI0006B543DB|nr:ubiquinone/menaquinone biosynthesis methyltransferase [Sulfobacillus thermosulfidooxidans]
MPSDRKSQQPQAETPELFNNIAMHYDRWSNLLSVGGIRAWHHFAIEDMHLSSGLKVLDVGCGTGTTTRLIAKKLGTQGQVVGLDPSEGMLTVAKSTMIDPDAASIEWILGSAEHLPFEDNTFDRVTAQFSLRNMVDWIRGLQEMMRVLKYGGELTILEMVQPLTQLGILARQGLDAVTATISHPALIPYQWLRVSLQHAPTVEELRSEMTQRGFIQVSARQWLGDLVVMLTGSKAPRPSAPKTSIVSSTIVWAMDGSVTSLRAARWINEFIRDGTLIHLVTVIPESLYPEQIQKTDRQFWHHQHSMAKDLLTPGKFQVETTMVEGRPGPTLVEFCQRNHVNMIVIGNKQRKIASDYWQESVSRYVSLHSTIPVLMVPTDFATR